MAPPKQEFTHAAVAVATHHHEVVSIVGDMVQHRVGDACLRIGDHRDGDVHVVAGEVIGDVGTRLAIGRV
ncbi:hypothetical protein QW131_01040 [Roseibium salinum]|nr:hypothetical protein [Roseibium salinum]